MAEILSSPVGTILFYSAVLAVLIAFSVYALGRFRGDAADDRPGANTLMAKFREMHDEGELSDEEFRTIKTLLKSRLQDEIKDTSDKG